MFNSNGGYSLADIAAATGNSGNNSGFGGDGGAWWIIIIFLFAFMNDGWGNNNGRNGNGNNNSGSCYPYPMPYYLPTLGASGASTTTFDVNLTEGIRGIQSGLCDGFYAVNTGMLNGFAGVDNAISSGFNATNVALMQGQNALATQLADCCCTTQGAIKDAAYSNLTGQNAISRQIADCCCETGRAIERGFADVNYNMATNVCALKTELANSTRDIIDSQNAGTRAILDYLCQEKISDLQAENQTLKFAASQAAQNSFITANQEAQTAEIIRRLGRDVPSPAYLVPNPNCCYGSGITFNSGCGCGY